MGLPPPPLLSGPRDTRREPARSILRVIGTLVAAALYLISAVIALRSLQPFSPPHADAILFVGVTAVAVLAFAASRAATISVRLALFVVVTLLGMLAPFAMAQWMPGVAQPREFPIPGGPDHVTSASPSGDADLYLMPDGQPDRTFALTVTPDAEERSPNLAPDGLRLVYTLRGADGANDLYLMDLDEHRQPLETTMLLDGPGSLTDTCWSPDGERLLIRSDGADGISTILELDLDTGAVRPFLENASNPQWSPDGRDLAFVSFRPDAPGNADIFVAEADGSHVRPVIDTGGDDFFPDWSPDGRWIAFTSESHRGDNDVFVARADGSEVRNLTAGSPGEDSSAGWTPQGQILFLSDRSELGGTFLYFMDRDGSDVRLSLIL